MQLSLKQPKFFFSKSSAKMAAPYLFCLLVLSLASLHSVVSQDGENKVNSGIRPRNVAPSFKAKSVIDDKFKDISLTDYTSRGEWVVLVKRNCYA
jgi:hypothetical protein